MDGYSLWSLTDVLIQSDTRFLVDVSAYWKIHGKKWSGQGEVGGWNVFGKSHQQKPPDEDFMASAQPPSETEYQFPATIFGFDMMEKK